MNPSSDNNSDEEQPEFVKAPVTSSSTSGRPASSSASGRGPGIAKPTRRAAVPPSRRNAADSTPGPKSVAPPDTAKTIAFAVCGVLIVGILGMGGYLLLRTKPLPAAKAPLDHLTGDARTLAEKAVRAEQLYKEGIEKSATKTLDSLRDADSKLTEANLLFNEIVDSNQTVEGYKEKIELAREKKMSIDKELKPIRVKIEEMETEERRARLSAAPKPTETTPVPTPPTSTEKEPAESELTDANLNRLFKDDPSEYERLAKIRKAKDPTFIIKKDE